MLAGHGATSCRRQDFYATLGRLAALVARQSMIVLVAATAGSRRLRDDARRLAPRFVEVWIDTSLAECRGRDPKGLYAAAARDPLFALPGHGAPYEPPLAAEVVAHGGEDPGAVERCLVAIDAAAEAPRDRPRR